MEESNRSAEETFSGHSALKRVCAFVSPGNVERTDKVYTTVNINAKNYLSIEKINRIVYFWKPPALLAHLCNTDD